MAADARSAAARDSSRRASAVNDALEVNRRELQDAYARLESELHSRREAERKLRDADRRKDEFLAMLAHELRNPLAPISMAAQILRAGTTSAARQEQTCQIIDRQVNHMKSLLDDLLDVSRVTGGMVSLAREPHDMRQIVENALEQSRPLINARGHHLTLILGQQALDGAGRRHAPGADRDQPAQQRGQVHAAGRGNPCAAGPARQRSDTDRA
ncbi:sensor histidine kinase KdpD [Massilia sp. PAMC28688]|uniref:sensor histidine kinase n=1 Tax=Massilia sp. PAMC28688 TaxID=2861283 RepID=UPI001E45F493|nr:HAMP domain-containing sensor histidine kinase [Massilia sp. PAMC28688]